MLASEVAQATHGDLVGPDVEAHGISFDSRALRQGQAFVALESTRDGHDFCDAALSNGAAFLLVHRGRAVQGATCVEVDDTVNALAMLGAYLRSKISAQLNGHIVGITGSVGKTSTKDLVLAVLSGGFEHVHGPEKSLNNDIGVPVTIINAPDDCDALVLEMGMRGFGEITRLCDIASPLIGVVTAVGDAHSARVGGIEGVVQAKAELLQSLPGNGVAIVNADSLTVMQTTQNIHARVFTYGSSSGVELRWTIEKTNSEGCCEVLFEHQNEKVRARVPFPGEHMVSNAAAAIAVGVSCEMPFALAVKAMASAVASPQRMHWLTTKSGLRVLDDSYNANSLSVQAALHTIAGIAAPFKFAVLGAMAEVDNEEQAHQNIRVLCEDLGIQLLALETDLYGSPSFTLKEILNEVQNATKDSVVLVKGSRAAATERVVKSLLR